MTLFPNHPAWKTPKGRLLGFASWLVMIVCTLAGVIHMVRIDSLLPGFVGAVIGFYAYCGLQWLATRPKKHPEARPAPEKNPPVPSKLNPPEPPVEPAKPEDHPQETAEEKLSQHKRFLLDKCREYLCTLLPEQIAKPRGLPYTIRFEYPGTGNLAILGIEQDGKTPGQLHLTTRVAKKDSDLCILNYMYRGTQEELLAYLADDANAPALLDSLQQLSDKMDDRD